MRITIPHSVIEFGNQAFQECTGELIINSNIPNPSSDSDSSPFGGSKFTKVTIGDSVTTIGNYAFWACRSLTSVTIGDSVTTIGDNAFSICDSLTSITIPDSVTSIGDYAYYSCSHLTSVYCKATTPPSLGDNYVFGSNGSGRKIYVPAESVDAYKSATNWSEYASAIVGYNF